MKYLTALICALGSVGFATLISFIRPVHYVGLVLIVWAFILLYDWIEHC